MKEFPENEEPYMHTWDLMKELGNQRELEEISVKLQAVCNNSSVPTNAWVNALFKHSEMLVMKDNIEEAIKTLKRICFILPPMPLPRLNYIDKSIKIKDEILDNIRNALQLPEEADQEPEFEDNSLFVDDEPIKGDNTMNESDLGMAYLDFIKPMGISFNMLE